MREQSSPVRGALAGIVGGAAGALVMNLVSRIWTAVARGSTTREEASLTQHGGRPDVEAAKKEGGAPLIGMPSPLRRPPDELP